MKNFKLALLATVAAASVSGVATAADGTLGATSQADSIVTIVKDNAVRITGVDDIDFGTQDFMNADAEQGDDVCVYSTTGDYTITASSANGASGAFTMNTGAGDTLDYSVDWSTTTGTPNDVSLTSGTKSPLLAGAGSQDVTTDFNCGGTGVNARFDVTIDDAAFNAAATGSYQDTLTLLVAPL